MSNAPEASHPIKEGIRKLRPRRGPKTVVLLGAGASTAFDYPLTRDFLPQIIKWLPDDDFLRFEGEPRKLGASNRSLLRAYLRELLPGMRKQDLASLPLVTSLLSLLDHSLASGQALVPERTIEETREARLLIERGILEAIAEHLPFTAKANRNLNAFCRILTHLKQHTPKHSLTVMTTNYDMAADYAAMKCANVTSAEGAAEKIDYGFRWLDPHETEETLYHRPLKPELTLLKLHGSTNWLRCPLCDNTYMNFYGSIWYQAFRADTDHANTCHCSFTRLQTQIISPSFVREMREPNLHGIWKTALDSLRAAERWLIIGYSFPDEDMAIRALFTRAYASREHSPEVVVVQNKTTSLNRYQAFFNRRDLTFCTGGIEALLNEW